MMTFYYRFIRSIIVIGAALSPVAAQSQPQIDRSPDVASTKSSQKSPLLAFALSAAAPGAGQLYTGKIYGLVYTAAEVGLWLGYAHYQNKAEDARIEYERYADAHWGFGRWDDWYDGTIWDSIGSETFERNPDGSPVKNHHYYEKLGKYPWAQGGWDDFDPATMENGVDYSPNHDTYLFMRKDKNALNEKATKLAGVVILNHVVSAFQAALLVRNHNRKSTAWLERTRVHLAARPRGADLEYRLAINLTY